MSIEKKRIANFDFILFFTMIGIFVIGLFFLYSASSSLSEEVSKKLISRQIICFALGIAAGVLFFIIGYRKLIDAAYFFYAGSIFLLAAVLFMGATKLGAQRWIAIGGITFQPSEIMKIIFILTMASYLGRRKEFIKDPLTIIGPLFLMGIPFLMIAMQPDLGTALVLIPIFLSMVLIAGVNIKSIFLFLASGALASPFFWHFLKDYQKKRLLVFMNPNLDPLGAGYTIIQSKVAIGSGQLFGKGWLSGTQTQLNFLPERHTDFIFSVVGEEWGFVGCSVLMVLFLIVFFRGILIVKNTNDIYGKLIGIGVITVLAFQVFVNIGMTLGLLPVVGLTLPFVSYGGTSLISSIFCIAILLDIGMRKPFF